MTCDELFARLRSETDPETRSRLMQAIAAADGRGYGKDLVLYLVELLSDEEDPDVQQWATVALRKLKHDPAAVAAMWECFHDEAERESARAYALAGLGRMGRSLSGDELVRLYRERRERPGDPLLTLGIRWTSQNSADPAILETLINLEREESAQHPPNRFIQVALAGGVRRCARSCLAAGSILPAWLVDAGRKDMLDRLGETRMQRMIAEQRARMAQRSLLPDDDQVEDVPLVPGLPLADVQEEQYVQDLAEAENVRIGTTRSYIRDQALARALKKRAGYACENCADGIASTGVGRQFVQVHHIKPLSEGGADVADNMVTLCPNCHGRLHAGVLTIEASAAGPVVKSGDDAPRLLRTPPASVDAASPREDAIARQILALYERLSPATRARLVDKLRQCAG